MNKRLLIILFLIPVFAFAQKGNIKGWVEDSLHKYALQSATVTVYQKADSTLLNYQITNAQGEFNIGDLPVNTGMFVSISFSGYISFSKEIRLDSASKLYDFKKIYLQRDTAKNLEEIVVKAVVPVKMNEDTLEINPRAFKLDSSAVVEDMLLRVPGVTMWSDGTITVNGKKVDNVFVDGKPFFGGSPEMATQNLPKTAIDKIQVYQEKDYSKQEITNTDLDSTLTMNIKLQPDKKKGYFGKATAGIGSDHRYEGDLSLQGYNKTSKLGVVGNINNINKSIDNVQSALQNNTFRSYNRRNYGAPDLSSSGVNTVHYFGATFQHNFNASTSTRFDNSINGTYDWRQTNNDLVTDRVNVQNLEDTLGVAYKLTTSSNNTSNSNGIYQSANATYQNRKRARSFSLNTAYNWNDVNSVSQGNSTTYKNDTLLASKGANSSESHSKSNNLNLSGYFNNNDYDEGINKKSFSTNYSLLYNSAESDSKRTSDYESFVDSLYTQKYDRRYHNESSNLTANVGLNYNGLRSLLFGNYNFWNINIGLRNNITVNKSDLQANVQELDTLTNTYKINEQLTNTNSVINIQNRPGISFFKTFTKMLTDRYYQSLVVRTDLQEQMLYQKNTSTLSYRNVERSYNFFTPASSVNYNYNRFNKYNLNLGLAHSSSATAPTIDQLYPIKDSINIYNVVVGNPNLKSAFGNSFTFNANYNSQKFSANNSYNAGLTLTYNTMKNGISDSSIYSGGGGRTAYLINIDHTKSFSGNFNANASFKLKKNMLQVGYRGGYTSANAPQYINSRLSSYKNHSLNNAVTAFYSMLDIFNITLTQSVSNTVTEQSGQEDQQPTKSKTYSTRANFNLTVPKDFIVSSNINLLNNTSANDQSVSAAIWNASVTYRFTKQKQAEIKFSAFDILHQNKNIQNTVTANSNTTTITNGLQQFYMLTLSYYPRKFGGKGRGSGGHNRTGSGQGRGNRS
ncbi:hypothetical protein A8C56_19065 [Niabella ginsenosidivorans]|uniref:Outer membrane protein beta-barrel domain-containing protein n=1 Tax=Niabella ginsenosidivorans TaxID=1176587 RepID=A0A1A9I807_9BACT|nr:outer membrane beta-barrel protein [Niabella ginsenosidivorans]ANH82802.1 hypothetical protein A8C56_19065 [Niabella ginsenosidivorans]